MNLDQIKRFIRSNRLIGAVADKIYLSLTNQFKEEKHLRNSTSYYIIRPPKAQNGLFGLYVDVVGKAPFALEKGYKPVVDFKNYTTVYSGEAHDGNDNVWKCFFEQPFDNSLENAYEDSHILSQMMPKIELAKELLNGNSELLTKYSETVRYINLNDVVRSYISAYMNQI